MPNCECKTDILKRLYTDRYCIVQCTMKNMIPNDGATNYSKLTRYRSLLSHLLVTR